MRYPVHVILMALTMFYLAELIPQYRSDFAYRNGCPYSYTTISNWCTASPQCSKNIAIQLIPALNFNSDEWH